MRHGLHLEVAHDDLNSSCATGETSCHINRRNAICVEKRGTAGTGQLGLRNLQNHLQCILAGSHDFCSSEQREQPKQPKQNTMKSALKMLRPKPLFCFGKPDFKQLLGYMMLHGSSSVSSVYQSIFGMQSLPGPCSSNEKPVTHGPITGHWLHTHAPEAKVRDESVSMCATQTTDTLGNVSGARKNRALLK